MNTVHFCVGLLLAFHCLLGFVEASEVQRKMLKVVHKGKLINEGTQIGEGSEYQMVITPKKGHTGSDVMRILRKSVVNIRTKKEYYLTAVEKNNWSYTSEKGGMVFQSIQPMREQFDTSLRFTVEISYFVEDGKLDFFLGEIAIYVVPKDASDSVDFDTMSNIFRVKETNESFQKQENNTAENEDNSTNRWVYGGLTVSAILFFIGLYIKFAS